MTNIPSTNHHRVGVTEVTLQTMVTAFQVDWLSFNQRLRTYPREARCILDDGRSTILSRVLQRRRSNYPPLQTVRRLLAIFPEAVWIGVESFTSPLHILARCNPMPEYLSLVRGARPALPQDTKALLNMWEYHIHAFGCEEGLVEFLTEGSREAAQIYVELVKLVEYFIKFPLQRDMTHCLLHAVAAKTCDLELLQIALQVLDTEITARDKRGNLPLHAFLATRKDGRYMSLANDIARQFRFPFDLLPLLDALVEAHPGAVEVRNDKGQLPLHIAIESGWDNFDILLNNHADSLEAVDGCTGWLPFQLAAVSPDASLSTVYSLLRRQPTVLQMKVDCTKRHSEKTR